MPIGIYKRKRNIPTCSHTQRKVHGHGLCKPCYHEKNKSHLRKKRVLYEKKNREKINTRNALYRKRNHEKVLRVTREWGKKNRSYKSLQNKKWAHEHTERIRFYNKRYQTSNPEAINAKTHRRRTRITKAGGSYTASEFKNLCKQCHYKCLCCGKRRKLTADHVVPVSKGGTSNIDNIQPLCGPCNSKKGSKCSDHRLKGEKK